MDEAVVCLAVGAVALQLTYLNTAVYRLEGKWRTAGVVVRDCFGFLDLALYRVLGMATAAFAAQLALGSDIPWYVKALVLLPGYWVGNRAYKIVSSHMRVTFAI